MPQNNTPIPDAALAELDRLHAAATPGTWRMFHGGEPLLIGSSGELIADMEYPRDAEWVIATFNAFPGLLARLEAAEREREELRADVDSVRNVSAKWLAENNARMKREGAAAGIEQAREMLSMAESGEEADEMMRDAAQRLRESD